MLFNNLAYNAKESYRMIIRRREDKDFDLGMGTTCEFSSQMGKYQW